MPHFGIPLQSIQQIFLKPGRFEWGSEDGRILPQVWALMQASLVGQGAGGNKMGRLEPEGHACESWK